MDRVPAGAEGSAAMAADEECAESQDQEGNEEEKTMSAQAALQARRSGALRVPGTAVSRRQEAVRRLEVGAWITSRFVAVLCDASEQSAGSGTRPLAER